MKQKTKTKTKKESSCGQYREQKSKECTARIKNPGRELKEVSYKGQKHTMVTCDVARLEDTAVIAWFGYTFLLLLLFIIIC